MIPRIEFELSRVVNEFCHTSVLYSDLMPVELSTGVLGNKAYQAKHGPLRRDEIQLELQKAGPFGESEWYESTTWLMKGENSNLLESPSEGGRPVEIFQMIRQREEASFGDIWEEARPRLDEYKDKFEKQWSPISDRVLSRLSELAKTPWWQNKIQVHFIDCLYGGFAWNDCIGFAAFPDMEVQKKFIAHELSELITPQRTIRESLNREGLDPGITHTVVDMLAYFSVKDFIAKPVFPNPERKGIRPNPNYYPATEQLYPIFESYAEDTSTHGDFGSLVQDLIVNLKPLSAASSPATV